jgi:glycerophosphoryl diester phosphodiesterase
MGALREAGFQRRVIICSQNWRHIDPLIEEPAVTAVHSVGQGYQLERLLGRLNFTTQGISIDSALLSEGVVARLHDRAPMVVTWPINSRASLERVASFGVDGVITDSMQILREVVESRPAVPYATL